MDKQENIKEDVEDYIETKIDLMKLRMIDKAGSALSGIIASIAFAFLGSFILLFLSISAALAVAELSGKNSLGFLTIAGFYTLILILLVVLKEKIITMPIINSMLKKYYYKVESK